MSKFTSGPPPTPQRISPGRKTPSPSPDELTRPATPESCPICLDQLDSEKDRCNSNNCSHTYCYVCLLEWSKNKRECPLCKRPFDSIIHNIKSYEEYEVHKLPPPQSESNQLLAQPESNLLLGFRNRFRRLRMQIIAAQSGASRQSSEYARRSRFRPVTTDFRRMIYAYGLFCEGASPPNGGNRFRRVTPEFYRRNPAVVHRLVPWLNRELVAILPHRDNVQSVLDHILREIRRIDMRSEQFYRSIRPFTLRHTDHFVHEFHQFAMSPLDMAGFDVYAKYPRIPRHPPAFDMFNENQDAPALPNPSLPARSGPRILDPPGVSSSSDSDIEVTHIASSAPLSRPRGNHSTPHQSRFDFLSTNNASDRQEYQQGHQPAPSYTPYMAGRAYSSQHNQQSLSYRLTRDQRNDVNRLERALMATEPSAAYSLRGMSNRSQTPVSAANNEPDYQTLSSVDQHENLLQRVRTFLNSTSQEDDSDMDMPLLADFAVDSTSQSPLQRSTSSLQQGSSSRGFSSTSTSTSADVSVQPSGGGLWRSTSSVATADSSSASGSSGWRDGHQFDTASVAQARRRDASPASSHSSDVIIVSEERPYRERTPVTLSTDSEDEAPTKPKVFKAVLNTKVRRLSDSSETASSPDKSGRANAHRRFHSPQLSEISDDEDPAEPQPSTSSYQAPSRHRPSASDSDCVIVSPTKVKKKKAKKSKDKEKKSSKTGEEKKRAKKRHMKMDDEDRHQRNRSDEGHDDMPARSHHGEHHKLKKKNKKGKGIEKRHRSSSSESSPVRKDRSVEDESNVREPGFVEDTSSRLDVSSSRHRSSHSPGTSGNSSGVWYLDYNCQSENREGYSADAEPGPSGSYPDITKQVRSYARKHLSKKYIFDDDSGNRSKKQCKKHNKGHKSSNQR